MQRALTGCVCAIQAPVCGDRGRVGCGCETAFGSCKGRTATRKDGRVATPEVVKLGVERRGVALPEQKRHSDVVYGCARRRCWLQPCAASAAGARCARAPGRASRRGTFHRNGIEEADDGPAGFAGGTALSRMLCARVLARPCPARACAARPVCARAGCLGAIEFLALETINGLGDRGEEGLRQLSPKKRSRPDGPFTSQQRGV